MNGNPGVLFPRQAERLALPGAELDYFPHFIEPGTADHLFSSLIEAANWQQLPIVLFGKRMRQPRLIAFHGQPGIRYSYSGTQFRATGWLPPLEQLRAELENRLGLCFNAVLCNRYRDGQDSMGWHADDESTLGPKPVIASISLGAVRTFRMRTKDQHRYNYKLDLGHGSLLLMGGDTQANWQHSLPKTRVPCGERINLTFRLLNSCD